MYEAVKGIHLVAVLVWMSGMAWAIFAPARRAGVTRRLYRLVVTPAMLVALALGTWLAAEAGWFGAGWLTAKLILVLGLAGLHGFVLRHLRRLAAGESGSALPSGALATLSLAAVAAIVFLVIDKPY